VDPSLLLGDTHDDDQHDGGHGDDSHSHDNPFHPIIQIPLPDWLFDVFRFKFESSIVEQSHGNGHFDFFEVSIPKNTRLDQFFGSGRPWDPDNHPTGSTDANGGSGKVRICRATPATFGWSFKVEELLRLLGVSTDDLNISVPETVPASPRVNGPPPASVPGKSSELSLDHARFAATKEPVSIAEQEPRTKVSRVVLDSSLAASIFLPAMFAAKPAVREKSRGRPKAQRKPWQIDFVGEEPDVLDPNRDFSVRAAEPGKEHAELVSG
jgi:hypothetical protein